MYGKISRILKTDTTEISYIYDATGQRIAKAVTKNNITDSTYYVRDASGNVMSVYEHNDTVSRGHVMQKEIDLYGSSRLGMLIADIDVDTTLPTAATVFFLRGKKRYELVNHLGNVLVVISDVKKPIRSLTDTNVVVGYEPKVVTATDYYPFGMQMPGRHGFATESGTWHGSYAFSIPPHLIVNSRSNNIPLEYVASQVIEINPGFGTGLGDDHFMAYIADSASMAALDSAYQLVGNGYRYGFNGQEHSTELGNDDYTAQFWEYDSRTGRRWNVDPVEKVWESPYLCFDGNPILIFDLHGDDGKKGLKKDDPTKPILDKIKSAKQRFMRWWNSVELTSQTNVEVNVGLQAGVNIKVNSLVNLKVEGGTDVNKLVDFRADAFHMENAQANIGFEKSLDNNNLQKSFLNVGLEAGIPKTKLTGSFGYDYNETEKYYFGYNGPRILDVKTSKGSNGNVKLTPFKTKASEAAITNKTSAKFTSNAEKNFYGLDLSGSIKALFGVKFQLKMGLQKK